MWPAVEVEDFAPVAAESGAAALGLRCLFLPPDRGPRPLAGGVDSAMIQIRLCFPAGIGPNGYLGVIVASWCSHGKVCP